MLRHPPGSTRTAPLFPSTAPFRSLSLSGVKHIEIVSRRGPHQIQMKPKELGELGELQRAVPHVRSEDLPPEEADAGLEPGVRKSVTHLRQFARTNGRDAEIDIRFDFYMRPVRIEGEGRVERLGETGRAACRERRGQYV